MSRFSYEVVVKVIVMWFLGCSRDETARVSGVSQGTVSTIWALLPSSLEYLRELGKLLKKLGCSVADALAGAKLLQLLKEHGVAPEKLPRSLEAIKKMSTEAGYEPEKVIRAATEVVDLETRIGKPYPEALKEVQTLIQRIPELERKEKQLSDKIHDNEEKERQTYQAANRAPEEIRKFNRQEKKFAEYGIDFKQRDTLYNVLVSIEECGEDPKQLVDLVKQVGPLKTASIELQSARRESIELKAKNEFADQSLAQKNKRIEDQNRVIHHNRITLEVQDDQIACGKVQRAQLQDSLEEADDLLKAMIDRLAKIAGIDDSQIAGLQIEAKFQVIKTALDDRLRRIASKQSALAREEAAEALAYLLMT